VKDSIKVHIEVKNTSLKDGDEAVQIYAAVKNILNFRPIKTLVGFAGVHVKAGAIQNITIPVVSQSLRRYGNDWNDYTV